MLTVLGAGICCAQDCRPYWKGLGPSSSGFSQIHAMDAGDGTALYAAGFAAMPTTDRVRRWTGVEWVVAGVGLESYGNVEGGFRLLTDNGRQQLYYMGVNLDQTRFMKRWPGPKWEGLPPGMHQNSYPLFGPTASPVLSTDLPRIAGLYGIYNEGVGAIYRRWVVQWTGADWKRLGDVTASESLGLPNNPMIAADMGEGPELLVTGTFHEIAGITAEDAALWNGTSWRALPLTGLGDPNFSCHALCVWDDGVHGPSLYAGLGSSTPVGLTAQGIARWSGTQWETVGGGLSTGATGAASVLVMTVFDDGTGPALFVAGFFDRAGGVPARRIAKWDGQSWSALGAGITGTAKAMAVANDGRGESLFITTTFGNSAGGGTIYGIAQYVGCKAGQCYPDCDLSHSLTANDFMCFLDKFAANDPYANCDVSTQAPAINAADFQCYLNRFAAGCAR